MAGNDDFWVSEVTENFAIVNHNEVDYEGYRDFAELVSSRFERIEAQRERSERIAALEKWDESLPDRWREARFNRIEKPVVKKILEAMKKTPRGSYFLSGGSGSGKTFVAYALVRRLIGNGIITPSQVKFVSERVLLGWKNQGFKGAEMFHELFSKRYRIYVFDGIGTLDPAEMDKIATFWEQLVDHIYNNDLIAIFTSSDTDGSSAEEALGRFAEKLSPSSEAKVRTMIRERNFLVEPEGSTSGRR